MAWFTWLSLCGGLHSIWTTVRAVEQARRDFRSFRRYTFTYGVLRFLGFGTFLLFYEASPTSVLAVLYALPVIIGLILTVGLAATAVLVSHYGLCAQEQRLQQIENGVLLWHLGGPLGDMLRNTFQCTAVYAGAHGERNRSRPLRCGSFVAAFSLVNEALRTVILPDVTALSSSSDRLAFRWCFFRLGPAFLSVALFALESVMNFSSETIASRHGYSKTIPKRCFRRGVGVPGPYLALVREDAPQRHYDLRGVQRTEVDRTHRLCVEIHAPRPASVGDGLPTDAAVAQSGRLRGDDPRSARACGFRKAGRRSRRRPYSTLAHPEIHPGERPSGRLRRAQGQEGIEYTPRWTLWDTCSPCA